VVTVALVAGALATGAEAAGASSVVATEAQLRSAWTDPDTTSIELAADITLAGCASPTRDSATDLTVHGGGHTLEQGCAEHALASTGEGRTTLRDLDVRGGTAPSDTAATLTTEGDLVLVGVSVTDAPHHAVQGRGRVNAERTTITGSGGDAIVTSGTHPVAPTVTCSRCTIRDNAGAGVRAPAPEAQVGVQESEVSDNGDDGIRAGGATSVAHSTVAGNDGFGIVAVPELTVVNSTVVGNATDGAYAYSDGGGINGHVTVAHATFADNGRNNLAAAASITSTLSATVGAGASNCLAVQVVGDHSLSDDTSCAFAGAGNVEGPGIDPDLGALAFNGGPTRTVLPRTSSPLVGAVPNDACVGAAAPLNLGFDQRAHTRPPVPGGPCSIGAVERAGRPLLPCPTPFTDVGVDHPFCRDIAWMSENGHSTGWPDGTYRPGLDVSRQALAAFLWRMAGSPNPPPGHPTFPDVPPGHDFEAAVAWLAAEGITTGYEDGTFRPTAPVTRQALAAMLWRRSGSLPQLPGAATFHDVGGDHPFHDAIAWLAAVGITTGYDDGTFRPAARTTRQAMAAFLHRYADASLVTQ
jgi:hypothetical protein